MTNNVRALTTQTQAADWRMRPRFEKQIEPKRERGLDTSPRDADWTAWDRWADARIQAALIEQQQFLLVTVGEALGEYVAEQRKAVKRELSDELRQLRIELAETQTTISELRSVLAAERGAIDMPSPLRAGSTEHREVECRLSVGHAIVLRQAACRARPF